MLRFVLRVPPTSRGFASALGAVGLLLLVAACEGKPPTSGVGVGSTSQAIVDGADDEDTPEANAVVGVHPLNPVTGAEVNCTGTLVTPRLVLTATHCLRLDITIPGTPSGAPATNVCRDSERGSVVVGLTRGRATPAERENRGKPGTGATIPIAGFRTVAPAGVCINQAPGIGGYTAEFDIGLVRLAEPVLGVNMIHPALYRAHTTDVFPGAAIAGWGITSTDLPATTRQRMILPDDFELSRDNGSTGWATLVGNPPGDDVRKGDSGGPIYRTVSGARQVYGVLSGYFVSTWWADVGTPRASDWIKENAQASAWGVTYSDAWYTTHGKNKADYWLGDADYTGICDTARDRDCDLWDDAHDNCPLIPNPDQEEVIPGGPGTLCSRCPYDPGNDEDNDKVCGPSAPGLPAPIYNRVDNCPVTANPDQKNCNELSERTLRRAVLGDACDPVPCPKIELNAGTSVVVQGLPFDPYTGFQGFGRVVRDRFTPHPVRPSMLNWKGAPLTRDAGEIMVANRFCQADRDQGFVCITPDTIVNEQVDVPEVFARERPWHRIRTKPEGAPFFSLPGTETAWPFTPASENGLGTRVWGYEPDYAAWLSQNLIPLPVTSLCQDLHRVGGGTCLDGHLWHHARTTIGYTNAQAPGGFVDKRGEDGRDLSNMFVPIAPDYPVVFSTKPVGKYRRLWWWQKLVVPFRPFLDDPRPAHHARLLGLDEDKVPVLVHDIGGGEVADAWLSAEARAHVSKHVVAPSLEPASSPGNLSRDVEAAVLSIDGTHVLDLLVSSSSQAAFLEAGRERGWSAASPDSLDAPSPRTEYTAFLSPQLGGVVVAGGRDTAGRAVPSVHLYRLGLGWIRVAPSTPLVEVRAAVYSPVDGMLWLLNAESPDKMQIMRVNPLTGETGKGASFLWNRTLYPSHALGLDSRGNVLLVASTATASRTMRLEVNPVDGKLIGTGQLTHEFPQHVPPVSAFGEVSFAREDAAGRVVGIERTQELPSGAVLAIGGMFR